ncbi:MAG: hypothetical protein M3Y39_22220, partial [Chloroflexota bacterium]|nr:hypothetical protein [Chloroflexota bacterium]
MNRYLLFDAGCHVCSSVAQIAEDVSDKWLTTRSLSDPEMQSLLAQAKKRWCWEPTLLEVKGDSVHAFTGIALSTKMLFGIGPRKAWKMILLMNKAVEKKGVYTPRRRFFARSGAILSGLLLGIGLERQVANAASLPPIYNHTHLSAADAHKRLDRSQTFQEAILHLGQPDWNNIYSYASSDGLEKGIVIPYANKAGEKNSTTFLAIDNPASETATVGVIGHLVATDKNHATLTWSTHKGEVITTQVFQDGKQTIAQTAQSSVHPTFNIGCFAGCIGANVKP